MEKELRKNRSRLQIFGGGVIAFTIWSFLKTLLLPLMLDPGGFVSQIDLYGIRGAAWILVPGYFLAVLLLLFLRIRIGLSARAEGRGKPRGKGYMVFAFLICAVQGVLLISTVMQLVRGGASDRDPIEVAGGLLVEIASAVTMGEMAVAAARVKRLTALLGKEG